MTKIEDIINFGKYKGKTFDEISDIEPSYILWLSENVEGIKLPKKWLEAIEWDVREEEDNFMDAYESFMSWND
jgi:hypothetical protein